MNVLAAEPEDHGLLIPVRRPAIPGWPQDVPGLLAWVADAHPDREALVGRRVRYTYRELPGIVERAALALARSGVRPGDRIAACLPNHPDIVIAFLATMRLGAIWTGINRVLPATEKLHLMADAGASLLLADDAVADELTGRESEVPELRQVIRVEAEDPAGWIRFLEASGTAADLPGSVDPFAPAAIAYTSGTTGTPKGAVHSQHNLIMVGAANAAFGIWRSQLRQGVVLSLTILNLFALGPLLIFSLGGTCVCIESPRPVVLADWIARERLESFSSVPTIIHDLLASPEVETEQLGTLTHLGVGGSGCPEPLRQAYRARLGGQLLSGYGMTEAPAVVTCQSPDRPVHPGGAGFPIPHIRISVTDPDGRELPPWEVGEICVGPVTEGPWAGVYTPFLGYWNRPEATEAALRGGLLRTGDLGQLDTEGELWVTGRMSEVINRGGNKVHPVQVEAVLAADPQISVAAVLGMPDERLGERVVAFVEPEPGTSVDVQALQSRCRAELARYQVPEEIHVVASLPRNAMGKVLKAQLRPA